MIDPVTGLEEDEEERIAGIPPPAPVAPVVPPTPAPTPAAVPPAAAAPKAKAPKANPTAGMTPDSVTVQSGSTSTKQKLVSPEMRAADAEVAAATQDQANALAIDEKRRNAEAEADVAKLEAEAAAARVKAQQDAAVVEEMAKVKAEAKARTARDFQEYQVAAQDTRSFFDTVTRGADGKRSVGKSILWGLAVLFGAGGHNANGEHALSRTIDDWRERRAQRLDALEKRYRESEAGENAAVLQFLQLEKEKQAFQNAAAHDSVATLIERQNEKMKDKIAAGAAAENARVAADHRQKSALHLQQIADGRAAERTSTTGSTSQTFKNVVPAGMDPATVAFDSQGQPIEVVDKETAKALRGQRPRLQEIQQRAQAIVDYAKTDAFKGMGGTVKSTGRASREMDGMIASLTDAMTAGKDKDTSERIAKQIKARFAPSAWTKVDEFVDDVNRVVEEERRQYDSTVRGAAKSQATAAQPPAAAAPAKPAAAPAGGAIIEVRNKKTGAVVRARRGADGRLYPVS